MDIAGDGSIQMNIQEMATAMQYNIPVKIVLLNNGYLGMVRQWQELFYEQALLQHGHDLPARLREGGRGLRLGGLAGDEARRGRSPSSRKGSSATGPVLMDFQVAREECVYPMVRPGASISEMTLGTREMTN